MTRLSVDNPFTGAVACEVELTDSGGVERVLETARAASSEVAAATLEERIGWVEAAMAAMQADAGAITLDVSRMMGKPLAQATGELSTMADRARVMCEIAPSALGEQSVGPDDGLVRRIRRLPLGVVLDLPAWNYPLATAVNAVVPALLSGNAVVIKHSPRSPLIGEHFAAAFATSGAPTGSVQALHADYPTTERVVADPRVDQVVFTGSVRGGEAISRALAGRFMHPIYELGGNDGAYVAADADVGAVAESLVDGACYNAGQSCCAVERIYVHASLYDAFLEAAEPHVRAYVMGDPLADGTTLGPVAQPGHHDALSGLVRDAERGGARLLAGGQATQAQGRGRFFEATLLADMRPDMRLMQEESFGPIVAVQKVQDDEEAIACINASRYGLTASVWTPDRERAERFGRELRVGTVLQNRSDFVDPWLPWSGTGLSGRGQSLSALGFEGLTRPRALHFRG